jgi:RNA polymerase sigma factor (sigma-70 family)
MTREVKTNCARRLDRDEAALLVRAAAHGDQRAWDALVDEYGGLIWAITRSYRLTAAEAADVSQTTWLRLCENVDRLRDPRAVGAWLATTARRECNALWQRSRTVVLVDDLARMDQRVAADEPLDAGLLRDEAAAEVRRALDQLPSRSRALLMLLMQDQPPSYEEVAARLDLPIGSIGPTRGRALARLRQVMSGDLGVAASA